MRPLSASAFAFAIALLAAAPAGAAVFTVASDVAAQFNHDGMFQVRLPGFNTLLGAPTAGRVTFTGSYSGSVTYALIGDGPAPASATVTVDASLGDARQTVGPQPVSLTFSGGLATVPVAASISLGYDLSAPALQGLTLQPYQDYELHAVAFLRGAAGASFLDGGGQIAGTVTIDYTYDPAAPGSASPVPEPASAALLGIGLLGPAAVRRRGRAATEQNRPIASGSVSPLRPAGTART